MGHRHKRQSTDGLLFLDLDNFEQFNEDAGSGTCDRFLRELAAMLGLRVRQRDALARLAGDTFALFIENCPEPRARKIAEEIREQIAQFKFEWQGQTLQTSTSGGLLILDSELPERADTLLTQAADLCHTAKTSGRNRIHTAHALPDAAGDTGTDKQMEQLRQALDQHRLILEFQALKPVASVTWGDHIEILCRIPGQEPDDTTLLPGQFLPLAERFDLAKRLDRQVIRQTLDWLGQHRLLEPRLKYCGFNLSLASVLDDTFADFMEQLLAPSPFRAECFCLEIREAHATQYPDEVAVLCDALHRIGCRVALEGAGASVESYSLAAQLPVDIIKLDRRVMDHLEDDPVQQVMVDALHRIAEAAGKETVATFIESDETLRKVRTLGIHFGQGYRLSKPSPLEQLKPAAVELSTGRIGG
jgi:diguanylate cyclase (GGDEF)-like protein